jgi:hypothetical protein
VTLTTHLHAVPKLIICGSIPPETCTSSWRGTNGSTGTSLASFYFTLRSYLYTSCYLHFLLQYCDGTIMFRVSRLLRRHDPFYNQVYRESLRRKSEACLHLMLRNLHEIRRNINTIVNYFSRILHMKYNVISEVEKGSLRRSSKSFFVNS